MKRVLCGVQEKSSKKKVSWLDKGPVSVHVRRVLQSAVHRLRVCKLVWSLVAGGLGFWVSEASGFGVWGSGQRERLGDY